MIITQCLALRAFYRGLQRTPAGCSRHPGQSRQRSRFDATEAHNHRLTVRSWVNLQLRTVQIEQRENTIMIKWGAITFGIGIAIMILDIMMARKKKEGFQPSDRQRILGILWISIFASGLVMGLIAFS